MYVSIYVNFWLLLPNVGSFDGTTIISFENFNVKFRINCQTVTQLKTHLKNIIGDKLLEELFNVG